MLRYINKLSGVLQSPQKIINGRRGRGIYLSEPLYNTVYVSILTGTELIVKTLKQYYNL